MFTKFFSTCGSGERSCATKNHAKCRSQRIFWTPARLRRSANASLNVLYNPQTRSLWTSSAPAVIESPPCSHTPRPWCCVPAARPCFASRREVKHISSRDARLDESSIKMAIMEFLWRKMRWRSRRTDSGWQKVDKPQTKTWERIKDDLNVVRRASIDRSSPLGTTTALGQLHRRRATCNICCCCCFANGREINGFRLNFVINPKCFSCLAYLKSNWGDRKIGISVSCAVSTAGDFFFLRIVRSRIRSGSVCAWISVACGENASRKMQEV